MPRAVAAMKFLTRIRVSPAAKEIASKATPGRSRPANTAYTPHRANQRSADSSPVFPTSTSTGTLPRAREIPKHTAAASTCPNRESIQPQNPQRTVRLGPKVLKQQIQQTEHRRRRGE